VSARPESVDILAGVLEDGVRFLMGRRPLVACLLVWPGDLGLHERDRDEEAAEDPTEGLDAGLELGEPPLAHSGRVYSSEEWRAEAHRILAERARAVREARRRKVVTEDLRVARDALRDALGRVEARL